MTQVDSDLLRASLLGWLCLFGIALCAAVGAAIAGVTGAAVFTLAGSMVLRVLQFKDEATAKAKLTRWFAEQHGIDLSVYKEAVQDVLDKRKKEGER